MRYNTKLSTEPIMRTGKRQVIGVLLTALLISVFLPLPLYGAMPQVTANAALVMDAKTGQVLYEKAGYQPMPPASTTKMITAILALEKGRLTDMVTVSPHASQTEESAMELKAGEKLTLESLLYGALLWSSNDACVAIGEYIGGSEEKFVQMMNEKAAQIGAKNTHFINTNGLPAKGHYSTAYDLALIARYALKNPVFAQMVNTRVKYIQSDKNQYTLDNTNRLLWSYEGADGVKTGTTEEAGLCLVSSATRNGRQVIAVVLRSDNRYIDSIKLLDHGFLDFRRERVVERGRFYGSVPVAEGKLDKVAVTARADVDVVVPVDKPWAVEKKTELAGSLKAPVEKGRQVGYYKIYVDGKIVGQTELVTMSAMPEASWLQKAERYLKRLF